MPKNRHRKGHQPVVAFRAMSAALVLTWLTGTCVHLVRLPEVRSVLSGQQVGDFGGSRRLGGTPLAAFHWPEPFFRPRGLHCAEPAPAAPPGDLGANASLRLVASNGFMVYRLGTAGVESPLPFACPVEEHDALVSARCEDPIQTECRATVAAVGSLWECVAGGREAPTQPLASLPRSYRQPADSPLVRWAAAGRDLQAVFAAPRRGPILELRRSGGQLRPVAELQPPPDGPEVEEWLSLAVARAGSGEAAEQAQEDVLLAVATPGPKVLAWSLSTGRHLGAWPLWGLDSRDGVFGEGSVGWCATEGGSLYSASALQDTDLSGIELAPWPVPRMS